jgi:predicted secreted protein
MEFTDNRGRRIVYVSRCLLNQNSRTPGIAVGKGAIAELIQILLDNELGIEQLPCPECLFWGGVSRKDTYRMQPLAFRSVGRKWFPLVEFFFSIWLYRSNWLCKREAARAVDRMEDYTKEGYTIVGIIGVDDSPTCGVSRTVDIMGIVKNMQALGISLEDAENPHIEKFRHILQTVRDSGSGSFLGSIMGELKKRHMALNVVGFDPWSDFQEETDRIADLLNLKH